MPQNNSEMPTNNVSHVTDNDKNMYRYRLCMGLCFVRLKSKILRRDSNEFIVELSQSNHEKMEDGKGISEKHSKNKES